MEDYEATYYVIDDKVYTPPEYFQRRRLGLPQFYAQDIVKVEVIKSKQLPPQKRAKQVAKLLAKINKDTLPRRGGQA